jgi:hypothetical protein
MIHPDASVSRPSQNETACHAVPKRPSEWNARAESMAAAGKPTAAGMLKIEWSPPVRVTSTHPASHGKKPTTTMPRPPNTSRTVASVFAMPSRSNRW